MKNFGTCYYDYNYFSQLSAFAMVESAECACVINALTGDVVFSKI